MWIKSNNESRYSERANTTRLRVTLGEKCQYIVYPGKFSGVHLLDACDMPSNILHGDGILDRQTVALTFRSSLIDQNTTVGVES